MARWHCPPDTGFEIRALEVWGRARYLSVTEAPHSTNFHTWMGNKQFCFFQTAETGNRTPDSGVKGSGANHYPRAPAQFALHECSYYFDKYKLHWRIQSYVQGPPPPKKVPYLGRKCSRMHHLKPEISKYSGGACPQTLAWASCGGQKL